jgi:hypothetical protein
MYSYSEDTLAFIESRSINKHMRSHNQMAAYDHGAPRGTSRYAYSVATCYWITSFIAPQETVTCFFVEHEIELAPRKICNTGASYIKTASLVGIN